MGDQAWRCPVCAGTESVDYFRTRTARAATSAAAFTPSSELFGVTSGRLMRCQTCGHGSLRDPPDEAHINSAYAGAADEVSLREEAGQVETARRALALAERLVTPGRLADLGCWTGSLLVAARQRGWDPVGIEPSAWASARAEARGVTALRRDLFDHGLEPGAFRLVTLCDVLEHLVDPGAGLDVIHAMLEPGGALYLTVPDAGSRTARALGPRWWSVLPMHLQYFTRDSLRRLLRAHGFEVRLMRSHAKAFTARYYVERLGGYSAPLERAAVGLITATRLGSRTVAPDFHDRVQVVATRVSVPG